MNILALCVGNSARSILLEAILNQEGLGRVTAYSAGSNPAGAVHPQSITLLSAKDMDTTGLRAKSWDEFSGPDAPLMDIVITVCGASAAETCPLWPGAPVRGHWGIEDPAAAAPDDQPQAFAAAYDTLKKRAEALLNQPIETMDSGELTALLKRIGNIT